MSDTQGQAAPGPNLPEYSVSELSRRLQRTVEDAFSYVRVRGEISGFKRAASGHLYLAIKDENAVLDAVCWRGTANRLAVKPEDGLEVICTGRITTYAARSKYQLVVESMELAGEGALLKLLEERRKALAAEGLFDEDRKQDLPYLPEVVGVVTSPTGAVIRDILHRLADRFPRRVLLWPVRVQGEGAAEQVAAAIEGFNALAPDGPVPRPDVLIVARGGGSIEDLWAFNEEIVVRAAAASAIPLISAVGHETDTTLIDFASDRRAPTPTAAAEIAVPVRAELVAQVLDETRRLVRAMHRMLDQHRTHIEGLARGLPGPRRVLDTAVQKLDDESERLANALRTLLQRDARSLAQVGVRLRSPRQQLDLAGRQLRDSTRALGVAYRNLVTATDRRLAATSQLLESVSYKRVLDRGYAVVRDADGQALTRRAGIDPDTAAQVEFQDGSVAAVLDPQGAARPAKRSAKPAKPAKADQGRLL